VILPNGWTIKPAKEICEKIQDGTHFSPKNQFSSGPFPYVTAKNVRPWGLDLVNLTYLEEEEHRPIYERSDTRKGDVLLVKDGVNAGDTAINTIEGEISLLSSVCFLRPKKILRSKFLRYYLQSPQCQAELLGNLSGSAIRRIILRKIRELPIIVAPLEEQDAIIKGLDTQLSRLD
jgi:type I restriction enzyme S subunit